MMMNADGTAKKIIGMISDLALRYIDNLKSGKTDSAGALKEISAVIAGENGGPLPDCVLERIFHEIIWFSRNAVEPVRVSYLGPAGTFSGMALTGYFGESVEKIPTKTIAEVFRETEVGRSTFGVVPVENSIEGSVTFTLDELIETDLSVTAEVYVRISYCIMSLEKKKSEIKRIFSHPQPVGQCKSWLAKNFPDIEIVTVDSTSRAAELAASDPASAAIASRASAELYGLSVLEERIEDARQNFTRFFIMGRKENSPTGNDKTSVICAVRDRPGALLNLLRPFSDAGINMTKIESRPDKKKMWEYNFFIDFNGHRDDALVRKTLDLIRIETIFLKILGSYPAGN